MNVEGHAEVHRLATDKAFHVDPELRRPLGHRARLILLHRRVDDALRHARIYLARGSLPHKDGITILAEMLAVRVPQGAPACIW